MNAERVLIVGGAGFLGAALTQSLTRQGHHVTVLDTYRQASDPFTADYTAAMAYRRHQLVDAEKRRGNACDPTDMLTAFEAAQPDRVVHLAALAHAPLNEGHMAEAVHISTSSLVNTLQMASRFRTRRVLLASSSYVYGDFRYRPCDETHPTEPATAYGAAKLAAEAVLRGVGATLHVPWTIVRLIAVYGPWDLNGKLSAQNLTEAAATGQLPIAGTDGDAGTDYTHVDDATKGMTLALTHEAAVGQVFNIARGRARTAQEVADVLTGLGYPTQPQRERVPGRPKRGALAIDKARSQLGYSPTIDLEHSLAECLAQATKRPAPATPSSLSRIHDEHRYPGH